MKVKDILQKFDELVPVAYSLDAKKNLGFYDNSGMILDCATDTDCVVCALDLCDDVVDYAIKVGAKLIITHHPAIYKGITTVDGTYVKAIANGITVYSAHLNFDVAVDGIDDRLAKMAGANQTQTLMYVNESRGFGRRFCIEPQTAGSVVNALIAQLSTNKYMFFGDKERVVKTISTHCGAGLSEQDVFKGEEVDLFISADIPHHVLLSALNRGKAVLQLTHYASEAFAMKGFMEEVLQEQLNIKCYFYVDERFL